MVKRGANSQKLKDIVDLLVQQKQLPQKNKDYVLTGNHKDFRECHIEPDWLLIYKIEKDFDKQQNSSPPI